MEGLSMRHWSLIARYLTQETTDTNDVHLLTKLLHSQPELKKELHILEALTRNAPDPKKHFNADIAFRTLHERLEREGEL